MGQPFFRTTDHLSHPQAPSLVHAPSLASILLASTPCFRIQNSPQWTSPSVGIFFQARVNSLLSIIP